MIVKIMIAGSGGINENDFNRNWCRRVKVDCIIFIKRLERLVIDHLEFGIKGELE